MARITIQKDVTKRSQDEYVNVPERINLLGWMIERYVTPPECGLVVMLNGDIIANSDEQMPVEFDDAIDFDVGEIDHVIIQHRPHGLEAATVKLIAVALLASAATILLAPKPAIPNNAGQESSSPNNQLTAATNEFRPRQAIPDIAGRIRAYPDFVQPSYYTYVDNQRIFTELLCIGVGAHSISAVRSEDTDLDEVEGSSWTDYPPGASIPDQLIVRGTNDVDGFEPPAANDPARQATLDGATIGNGNTITGFDVDAIQIQVGDIVEIDMTWQSSAGTESATGFYEVGSVIGTTSIMVTPNPGWDGSEAVGNVIGFIRNTSVAVTGQWFTLVGDSIEDIWFQVIAPQGVRSDAGGSLSINLSLYYQRIDSSGDPIASEQQISRTISGNTVEAQRRTFKTGPITPGRYRARVVRNTVEQGEGGRDQIQVEDIQSIRSYTPDFGAVHSLLVERRGTINAVTQRQSKINADVEREIPIFNPDTGAFGEIDPTRSFAQYVMYLLHTLGGVPLSHIDYEALFDIEQSLPPELAYFDFSFDDADVSLRERVITACNVARVRVFYVGATWNFVREEPRPNRVALFSRRNIAPNSSSQTFRFQRDGDPDGVTIKWVDPSTNAEAYEYRRWDDSQVLNEQALRPIEEALAGCRNQAQAANRADWEMNKLLNQRRRVTDTIIKDAFYVGLGERVGWVDINDADLFDGEIMGISGSDYDTSERFTPESGTDYYVYITDDEGNTSATVQAYPRTDTEFGFSAPGLSGAYVATGIQQLGSRYFIASQNELDAADFIVVSKGRPDEHGRVQVELAEVIEE